MNALKRLAALAALAFLAGALLAAPLAAMLAGLVAGTLGGLVLVGGAVGFGWWLRVVGGE